MPKSPKRQAQELRQQVRRQEEKPDDGFAFAQFAVELTIETGQTAVSIFAKDCLPDEVNAQRQDGEADENQTGQQRGLFQYLSLYIVG